MVEKQIKEGEKCLKLLEKLSNSGYTPRFLKKIEEEIRYGDIPTIKLEERILFDYDESDLKTLELLKKYIEDYIFLMKDEELSEEEFWTFVGLGHILFQMNDFQKSRKKDMFRTFKKVQKLQNKKQFEDEIKNIFGDLNWENEQIEWFEYVFGVCGEESRTFEQFKKFKDLMNYKTTKEEGRLYSMLFNLDALDKEIVKENGLLDQSLPIDERMARYSKILPQI